MAMLTVDCFDCNQSFSLRGWVEPEDLRDTKYKNLTQSDIKNLEKKTNPTVFLDLDPWSKFDNDPRSPNCKSKNIIAY